MQMARLLCLVTFYSCIMVSIDSVDVDRVGTMNELLSYSGWPEFNRDGEPLKVIFRWLETEEFVNIHQLLELSANGRIVTEGNADLKIGLAHQFLSCKYADVFKNYCTFVRGIVHQCRRIENSSEASERFESFLKDLFENNDRLLSRMRGALEFFYKLSPNTVHNNDVFQILEDFINYYNAKHFEASTSETGSVFKAQISAIEKHMFTTIELLSAFFKSNCWPVPEDRVKKTLSSYDRTLPRSAMHRMRMDVRKIVDECIKAHYELLGFEYVPESGTTRIDYDPETLPRVNKMNDLLSFTGWSEMVTDEIFENSENMRFTISVYDVLKRSPDGTIVSKNNVGDKIRQVHQMLSCEYIIVMKTCHDHLLGIADECSKQNTADCWKHFWLIVKEIDPMVLHMQGSLSYFYQLSSETEYAKGVYEILGELKNYYDSVDLSESLLNKAKSFIVMKLWKMESLTKKINPLFEYFRQHCWTIPPLFNRPVPKFTGLSVDLRAEEFKKVIKEFIEKTYGSFGFTYNRESDTTDVLKNESSDDE